MCILCSPQRQDANPVKPTALEQAKLVCSTLAQEPALYKTFPSLLSIRNKIKTGTVAGGWSSGHTSVTHTLSSSGAEEP